MKGYYFYLLEEQKLFIGLRATFLEKEFLGEATIAFKVELSEVQQVEMTYLRDTIESTLIRSNPNPIEEPLRRSGRVPYQPDRYYNFLI